MAESEASASGEAPALGKKGGFRLPSAYTILFALIVLAAIGIVRAWMVAA